MILHNTENAYWYELVFQAQSQALISLDDDVLTYTALMLNRSVKETDIADTIIALEYLKALQKRTSSKIQQLKQVAEYSLILAALFPLITKKRNVSVEYYAQMSQNAYVDLACLTPTHMPMLGSLYEKMVTVFEDVYSVLCVLRKLDNPPKDFDNHLAMSREQASSSGHGLKH